MLSANIQYNTSAQALIEHTDLSTATIETSATHSLAACVIPKMSSIKEKEITLMGLFKDWCKGDRRRFKTNKIRVREG